MKIYAVLVMRLEAFLVLVINTMAQGMRRGPHHPSGQSPVGPHHHHYKPMGSESLMGDSRLLHDAKHLEEDSHVLSSDDISKMTPEELEFHYFSAHDFDRNSKLDGSELLKAIYHTVNHVSYDMEEKSEIEPDEFEGYVALVDKTLETDDIDGDGFVSYGEYRAARAKEPAQRTPRVIAANTP